MNLALEQGERVFMGGKCRGEIRGEAGEVTGVVADAPTTNSLGIGVLNNMHNTVDSKTSGKKLHVDLKNFINYGFKVFNVRKVSSFSILEFSIYFHNLL